ncbi:tRNA-intron lyase [Candidatus Bathyarchaeota archaeon]|nr:MAG: tRNA-intron lyase [Candidatus Bathyarchaeota archaeon]
MGARAFYRPDGAVVIVDAGAVGELRRRGYGRPSDEGLVLDPWEALYLVEKGRLEVLDSEEKRRLDFQELLERLEAIDKRTWAMFLIYRDLRERGYVVRSGFGQGLMLRLYARGEFGKKPAKYIVYGILEGVPVQISGLEEVLKMAQSYKKELILAVVDRRGEVVYYSVSSWRAPRGEALGPQG